MKTTDFAYHLAKYFKMYMPGTLGLRKQSILSYKKGFYAFFRYMKSVKDLTPDKITIDSFSVELIMEFLDYLENNGNSVSTRNHRLTVLRAFFKYVQLVDPEHVLLMQQLLSVKHKKSPKPVVNYLTINGIKCILGAPSSTTRHGYRDMMLIAVLYETGARVSEITGLTIGDIRFESPATAVLHGKLGKSRIVPLSDELAEKIRNYITKENLVGFEHRSKLLFVNRSGNMLTGAGVRYILKKYADSARKEHPALIPEKLSPHSLRHSKAMHLLQSGVDLIYIRDVLGHEHLKTTEIYAKTDSDKKRKAIEAAYCDLPDDSGFAGDWSQDVGLMQWLDNICR